MRIFLNGKVREVAVWDLAEALDVLGYRDTVVATAVNGRFVPVTARRTLVLAEGDEIEVVAPMQGG